MSLFKTPTPGYRRQPATGVKDQPQGVAGWLSSLLRTPTPAYKRKPATADLPTHTSDKPGD